MGEQFIKVITDIAISEDVDICYVTIFKKHSSLINLIERFGFKEYGKKYTDGKEETVYLKNMRGIVDDILLDYPIISNKNVKKYLLSVYPRTYNVALNKRITRHDLIEEVGIDRESNYWGFVDLTDGQFEKIIHYGKVNPRILHERMF